MKHLVKRLPEIERAAHEIPGIGALAFAVAEGRSRDELPDEGPARPHALPDLAKSVPFLAARDLGSTGRPVERVVRSGAHRACGAELRVHAGRVARRAQPVVPVGVRVGRVGGQQARGDPGDGRAWDRPADGRPVRVHVVA